MKTGRITIAIEFVTRSVGAHFYSVGEVRVLIFLFANGCRVEHGLN